MAGAGEIGGGQRANRFGARLWLLQQGCQRRRMKPLCSYPNQLLRANRRRHPHAAINDGHEREKEPMESGQVRPASDVDDFNPAVQVLGGLARLFDRPGLPGTLGTEMEDKKVVGHYARGSGLARRGKEPIGYPKGCVETDTIR